MPSRGLARWSRVTLAAVALLAGAACSGGGGGGGDEAVSAGDGATPAAGGSSSADARELSAGTSGSPTPGQIVATSAAEWTEKWTASGATGPAPDVSEVDFENEVAVALFAGERPSGGWKIDPEVQVKRQGVFAALTYVVIGPGKGCASSQALTSPYLVLAVRGERVRFESTERMEPCE